MQTASRLEMETIAPTNGVIVQSINIPTQIATSLEPLAHGLERLLASHSLPTGTEGSHDPLRDRLVVSKGKSTLSIPSKLAEQLRAKLDPQEFAHLFRALPKELCLYFLAARKDYLRGMLNDGLFALSRRNSDGLILPVRRICQLGGRDPDSPNQLQATMRLFMIMRELRFTTEINGEEIIVDRLVRLPKDQARYLRGAEIGEGQHRGGTWVCAQIHPKLFSLMTHRFIQCPENALSDLKPRDFNTYLAIAGQMSCRQSNEITLSEQRLIQDAGHSQTTTKGDARERKLLARSIAALERLGYLASAVLTKAGHWILGLEPETLLQNEPEPLNPAAPPPLEPETLLRQVSETKSYQALKAYTIALARTLEKGLSTVPPPYPSGGADLIEAQKPPI